ncbi:MAG: glycoside hydrolase family 43 protein [Oscillospiraceae bacterium]|nr:glycoside hydrolase family 43 protein [Oscillospiraceae bacterium]
MKYTNPVIKGFYPDPSVCAANGKYYLVCSSFQYFPGVPLFESDDLVNWTQIGHVLTRKSQVELEKVPSSGGVFAPTIRFDNGRFYMVTNNNSLDKNFYVYTDDIYGEWSEPIYVDQDGIDPSLYFEDGRAYFMTNGTDDKGKGGIVQCEIDIKTGEKLSPSKCVWTGTGGRFLESPHLYKINGTYYLMAAEGGTEYGHMITYARADGVWGEFEGYANNPVLTNRNKAPRIIQGIGHGDLVQDAHGDWHIVCLGFRQLGMWQPYHNLGREVFLVPVTFSEDGWFNAGNDGTCEAEYEINGEFTQTERQRYTLENTGLDRIFMRHPITENYEITDDRAILRGTDKTLDDADNPTFVGIRQREFNGIVRARVELGGGEAGITAYMCEQEHYDIAVRKNEHGFEALARLNIGGIKHIEKIAALDGCTAELIIKTDNNGYTLIVDNGNGETILGYGQAKYLSSEVSGGFTGVVLGMYAVNGTAEFTDFEYTY